MRLLNVNTLELSEFFEDEIPLYNILSHRWGKDEVSYQDFVNGRKKDGDGFKKIRELCAVVRARKVVRLDGTADYSALEWVWIDTCCIDKTSSSELSEAINSMYEWYSKAVECLVYLADVPSLDDQTNNQTQSKFEQSEWFTRGWTLQELLAPSVEVFYSSSWHVLGHVVKDVSYRFHDSPITAIDDMLSNDDMDPDTGSDYPFYGQDLSTPVSQINGIQVEYLNGSTFINKASVARRMSWASQRRTTRREDMAYCLLGLFDVNMPLLYGEGHKAFLRLQEEIIKRSDDQSIFAWCNIPYHYSNIGLIAPGVASFRYANNIRTLSSMGRPERPYMITNLGLQIHVKSKTAAVAIHRPDPRCVPHVIELAGVCAEEDMHNVQIIMLQCLHDKKRIWYRSRSTDLSLRGEVSNRFRIPVQDEKEANVTEIFAAIHQSAFSQCRDCSSVDKEFRESLEALALAQGLKRTPNA